MMMMSLLAGSMLACVGAAPPSLPRPSAPQLWYSQGEIMALVHFNMASFVRPPVFTLWLNNRTPGRLLTDRPSATDQGRRPGLHHRQLAGEEAVRHREVLGPRDLQPEEVSPSLRRFSFCNLFLTSGAD